MFSLFLYHLQVSVLVIFLWCFDLLCMYRASSDSAIHSSVTTTSASHMSGTGSMLLSNGLSVYYSYHNAQITDRFFKPGTDLISLLILFLSGQPSSKKPKASSFWIKLGWNLAWLFFSWLTRVGFLMWWHTFKMVVVTSTCCFLLHPLAPSTYLQFLIHSTFHIPGWCC